MRTRTSGADDTQSFDANGNANYESGYDPCGQGHVLGKMGWRVPLCDQNDPCLQSDRLCDPLSIISYGEMDGSQTRVLRRVDSQFTGEMRSSLGEQDAPPVDDIRSNPL